MEFPPEPPKNPSPILPPSPQARPPQQPPISQSHFKSAPQPSQQPHPQALPKRSILYSRLSVILMGMGMALLLFLTAGYFLGPGDLTLNLPGIKEGLTIRTPKPVGLNQDLVLLVMGVDSNNSKGADPFSGTRSDTMMLVRVSPSRKTVSAVSIPRDSRVFMGQNGNPDKINAAFAIGGANLAVETVENAFGIPVDGYIAINNKGVQALVDAIGGVTVDIDRPMKYTDRTAGLYIDFSPGRYRLDGKTAEGFLRFRHDELGDIGRVRRQQQFMTAIGKELRNPVTLTKLPQLVSVALQYIQTNLSPQDLLALGWFGREVDLKRVRVSTLPGHPSFNGISYWMIDPSGAQQVLDRLILNNPGRAEGMNESSPLKIGIIYSPTAVAQLETWQNALEAKGFDVVCKTQRRRISTQLVEHTDRVSDEVTAELQAVLPEMKNARLIFAPAGSTYEQNSCSGSEDYTLLISPSSSSS